MEVTAVADRRILRAFYTQYVAVLLIVLTFTLGAFQRGSQAPQVSHVRAMTFRHTLPTIGTVVIPSAFSPDGALIPGDERLEAVAKVLEEHDLRAVVTLSIPRLDFDERSSSMRRTLRRLEALENYFKLRAIPPTAVRFTAQPEAGDSEALAIRFYNEQRG